MSATSTTAAKDTQETTTKTCQIGGSLRAAARRLRGASLASSLPRFWRKLRSWVWYLIEELFEEFQPWLKWIVFDAALTLLVAQLVKRFAGLQPLFEAVGWV